MGRETVAQIELDKAEARLRKNGDLVRKLTELFKDAFSGADMSLNGLQRYTEINGKKYTKAQLDELGKKPGYAGIGKALAGIVDDIADGQSFGHTVVGAAVDFGLFAITKFIPVVGWITLWYDIGNLLDKLDGKDSGIFDLRKQAQNLWDKISGDGLSDIDQEALKNGILKITMPDNTVYARPLSSSFFPYGVTPSGLLTGDYKDDVLFGGYGDDTLMGKNGSDLLIGGAGHDTYNATDGDIIRDSDGKGEVHFRGHKLTGGTYDEDKGVYVSKDYIEYKLQGNKLIVSNFADTITIENYDKEQNSLGIYLLDKKDIIVTISDESKAEGDTAGQSMNFTIKLNRKLEKDEYLNLLVWEGNGKSEIVSFKENQDEATYTYTWSGDKIPQEDKKFKLSAGVWTKSENINLEDIVGGNGVIENDDDRDPKDDLPETYDPIVIDFNKNGITSTRLDNTAYFDHDNNSFKEATAWIEKDDGLLALDKNDNGSELFGDKTVSVGAYGYTGKTAENIYRFW